MVAGATVSLRPFDRRHLDRTREWMNDPELSRLLGRALPVSETEHERWYAELESRPDRVLFAVETHEDRGHIGNVWLWDVDWRHRKSELRVVIGAPAARGRGQGSEAIDLLCGYAFSRLNLHRVYAYVLADNGRALRAFEKVGFKLEGVLREDRWDGGRYTDVHLLGRLATGV